MESTNPPWRVFDSPGGGPQAAAGGPDGRGEAREGRVSLLAFGAVATAIVVGGVAIAVALGGGSSAVTGPGGANSSIDPRVSGGGLGGGTLGDDLVVDVTGAVEKPGVYHLAPGSRLGDAINAAGGFSARVDADRVAAELNLASTLSDGQQVRVPSRDDPGAAVEANPGTARPPGGLIDLNAATESELESLPGIGPVTAGRILEARAQSPFRTIDELRERSLVGQKTFDSIRALITVG